MWTHELLAVVILAIGGGSVSGSSMQAHEVVDKLRARDEVIARQAVRETFELGASAIPELLKLRGSREPFKGGALGHAKSAQATFEASADVEPERIVSVEVAAIYLIEAIYQGKIDFAQSAYLTDLSKPEEDRSAANTSDRIDRAWESIAQWESRTKEMSLDELRRQDDGPLKESSIRFW